MKTYTLIFIFFTVLYNCNGQTEFPSDLQLDAVQGKLKTIIETSDDRSSNFKTKNVYHFDKSGYQYKIEHFNVHSKDSDTLSKGDVTYISNDNTFQKRALTFRYDKKRDTSRIKTSEIKNDGKIYSTINDYSDSGNLITKIEQLLDSDKRVVQVISKVTNEGSDTVVFESRVDFFYKGNQLERIRIDDKEISIVDVEQDRYGNFLKRNYVDSNGNIRYTMSRTYEYY